MIEKKTADAYRKMFYGENSIHAAAHLIVQYQGEQHGQAFTVVAGLVMADLRSPDSREKGFMHEFVRGDVVLRVGERYADNEHLGQGIASMLTDRGLFPVDWRYRANAAGILVPNPEYGDMEPTGESEEL